MNNRIRFLAFLLVLALLAVPAWTAAEGQEPEKHKTGSYTWILLEDGSAEIVGFSGSEEEVTVPSELDGKPVTSIAEGAFSGREKAVNVSLPDSIARIGANPFTGCEKLAKFIVSRDHPYLAAVNGVLYSKPDRRLVCCPAGYTAAGCDIPRGIRGIGKNAFNGCTRLNTVTIPETVTAIGDTAFSGCKKLKEIRIPDAVTSIGANPFAGCSGLAEIILSGDHPALEIRDGVLLSKADRRVVCCLGNREGAEYAVPEGTETIGAYAFDRVSALTAVTVPETVTSIGEYAFRDCRRLASVSLPAGLTDIGYSAFPDELFSNGLSQFPVGTFPEDYSVKSDFILPEGSRVLPSSGVFFSLLPASVRTVSPEEADYCFVKKTRTKSRSDYTGPAHNTITELYLCGKDGSVTLICSITHSPPAFGMVRVGQSLGGSVATDEELWKKIASKFPGEP